MLDDHEVNALLDTGSQVNTVSMGYVRKRKWKIEPLGTHIHLTGAGGATIPYIGLVAAHLSIGDGVGIKEDIIMLVLPDNPYHERVPVTLGTPVLSNFAAQNSTSPENVKQIAWKTVLKSTAEHSTWGGPREDGMTLSMIAGEVKTTRDVYIPPGTAVHVKAQSNIRGFVANAHVMTCESPKIRTPAGINIIPEYSVLRAGSCRVGVTLHNSSPHRMLISAGTKVAEVQAANALPAMLAPREEPKPQDIRVARPEDPQWLLDKLDLSGLEGMPEEAQEAAKNLLRQNADIFSYHSLDLGKATQVKHPINLSDKIPFKERARRIPPHMYDEVRKHLKEMLEIGAIRNSQSPWASAVVLVRKKDGALRFCIDLRKLNARTVKDAYALPRIEDTLDCLTGTQWFSTLDQKTGYWQVEIKEEDKCKTAFTVGPLGFYECERMPFGLTNAPATFQRLMENCLGDLHLKWCLIYLDDIVVFSATFNDHLVRLKAVFDRLREAGVLLKPSKCFFFKKKIHYLGHVVSPEGIGTDPAKIEAMKKFPRPETLTQLRSFLGLVGYYRKFIKQFSQVASPLYELTKGDLPKNAKIKWTQECEDAFNELKERCCQSPVLGYADFTIPFKLKTDASTRGLGAVLCQDQKKRDDPENQEERVIGYASRSLSTAEGNYPAHKLEFLALKWSVTEKFHPYLYGNKFQVFTDSNPLTYVLTTAKLDATSHRWVATLSNYDFELIYRSGKTNTEADALSRIEWPEAMKMGPGTVHMEQDTVHAVCHAVVCPQVALVESVATDPIVLKDLEDSALLPVGKMNADDWRKFQAKDGVLVFLKEIMEKGELLNVQARDLTFPEAAKLELLSYLRNRKKLALVDGVLYREVLSEDQTPTRLQLLLPKPGKQRLTALEGCHDEVGHLGLERTLSLLRDRFFWPRMAEDAANYIGSCDRCIKFKAKQAKAPMKPLKASYPMELVHMDFLCIEPCKGKIENVLVITDHFTRYSQAYPTKNQTAKTTAKVLLDHFVVHYGFPTYLLSDKGANFESHVIKELCRLAGVTKKVTSPYHPQTNGQCERFNQTLLNMLGTLTDTDKKNWKDFVPRLVHAYNCTRNSSTGYTPYFLLFGRTPQMGVDVRFGLRPSTPYAGESPIQYVERLRARMQWAHKTALHFSKRESKRFKQLYDNKVRGTPVTVGDLVLVKITCFKTRHKIQNKWEANLWKVITQPHAHTPVFRVQDTVTGTVRCLHRNFLLPVFQADSLRDGPAYTVKKKLATADKVDVAPAHLTVAAESSDDDAVVDEGKEMPPPEDHWSDVDVSDVDSIEFLGSSTSGSDSGMNIAVTASETPLDQQSNQPSDREITWPDPPGSGGQSSDPQKHKVRRSKRQRRAPQRYAAQKIRAENRNITWPEVTTNAREALRALGPPPTHDEWYSDQEKLRRAQERYRRPHRSPQRPTAQKIRAERDSSTSSVASSVVQEEPAREKSGTQDIFRILCI